MARQAVMARYERDRSALDRCNRHHLPQVFAAASALHGIERFREPASCRMLEGCLILAAGRADDPDLGFHQMIFGITLPRRNVA